MTPKQRREFLESLPYVKRLEFSFECDGYKPMSMKAMFDPVLKERYACKLPAYWQFKAIKNSRYSKSGIYCMHHLISDGTSCGDDEQARTHKHWNKFKEEVLKIDIQTQI